MNGWIGKILRVDLSNSSYTVEDLDPDLAKDYVGGRGLAEKYLVDEVDPTVDPLSEDNKLIFATGPLTGTGLIASGRYMVITKSPLNNCIACSNSGGYFGPEMKYAGYDMIIFEGKAPEPVYLMIKDDVVEFKSAVDLWGKPTDETEDLIRAEIGSRWKGREFRIASIGPAGERLCRIACVINDKSRAAGRSGVGAVMGSKNLKALVVMGTKGIPVPDRNKFRELVKASIEKNRSDVAKVTAQALPIFGTSVLVNIINESGILCTRNFQTGVFADAMKISGENIKDTILKRNKGCFACPMACGRATIIKDKKFAGEGEGPEYETVALMGASCGINDLAPITKANYICNQLGMDTIDTGNIVACLMELYEKGYLPEKDIGFKANFGNGEALVKLTTMMGLREGIGDVMAEGGYALAEKYGHPELFMGVKKQGLPAYDPRGVQSMGLSYATSNRGACHVRSYGIAVEILGVNQKLDPLTSDGKHQVIKAFQDLTGVVDSSGLCLFVVLAEGFGVNDMVDMLETCTGAGYTAENVLLAGERIWNMERLFNLKAGITKADDTLPPRFLKEPMPEGPAKGLVSNLDKMLPLYY
ncbi:MAG: aldehyde ferredoxin oxidoreductase family protein, partial [Proteobacteria bacterium]|nr:aldehyde ferredoxin oxidoreductase family protein [Pseudomonadota bacterium]